MRKFSIPEELVGIPTMVLLVFAAAAFFWLAGKAANAATFLGEWGGLIAQFALFGAAITIGAFAVLRLASLAFRGGRKQL
jgi:hypothetical protein